MTGLTSAVELLEEIPTTAGVAMVRDGAATILTAEPSDSVVARGPDALDALTEIERRGGWWAGYLAYDLGRAVEHIPPRLPIDPDVPDVLFARFDARLVLEPGRDPVIVGSGEGARLLEHALRARSRTRLAQPVVSHWTSSLDRRDWRERIAAIHELLLDGECYQINLTRRLSSPVVPDPRALMTAAQHESPSPHAAMLDLRPAGGPAIVSASPERFLARRGDRVETRPIKGTHRDARVLAASAKNRAENVMIVDLTRNDLGRVCRPGSIDVPDLCVIERHPGLHHLVSTVRGELERSVGLRELVTSTFPPASITGAPKPRVMRAIEELEPVRRGVYCGAIGWIDADRHELDLNVAIRTFTITASGTSLGVGGGIVADSEADDEWNETCLKAHRLLRAVNADVKQATVGVVGG